MKAGIPEDVERFLIQHISSTEQLEVLLRLAGQPERTWTAEAVYAEIKTNLVSISNHLQEYHRRGLLIRSDGAVPAYGFKPNDPKYMRMLQELSVIYRREMHRVIDVIYSKPSTAVISFADAFRLRKD